MFIQQFVGWSIHFQSARWSANVQMVILQMMLLEDAERFHQLFQDVKEMMNVVIRLHVSTRSAEILVPVVLTLNVILLIIDQYAHVYQDIMEILR